MVSGNCGHPRHCGHPHSLFHSPRLGNGIRRTAPNDDDIAAFEHTGVGRDGRGKPYIKTPLLSQWKKAADNKEGPF